ncbi:MAG: LLM class flavin-dependent oxidoreductase [Myxococcota bacterium]
MDLGLVLTGGSARGNVDLGIQAEQAGFDAVYACEFFNQQAYTTLSALAQATKRVKLGTGIANAFVRSPLATANAAMDIDELSNGRMILGLGSGTARMNKDWFSVPFSRPAARMRELVTLLGELFAAASGLGFAFEGEFWNMKIPVYSRPKAARPDIPIFMAAVNRGMIRSAGACASGLVGHPIATRRWHREVTLPLLREEENKTGREAGACPLVPYVMTSLHPDRRQAIADAKGQIGFYYTVSVYHSILEYHGLAQVGDACRKALATFDIRAMAEAIPDELVEEIAIACPPDEAHERLAQWKDLAGEVMLYAPQVGVAPERIRGNLDAILEVFGR